MNPEMCDPHGRMISPGSRVLVGGQEAVVSRLEPRYGVLTIVVDGRTGKSERMVRASEVEVVEEPTQA